MSHDDKLAANAATFMPMTGSALSASGPPTRWRYGALVCVFAAVVMLQGCASVKVTTQPIDSPQPVVDMGENPVYCLGLAAQLAAKASRNDQKPTLGANQSCWFVVQSDAPENATGLKLDPNLTYAITVPAGQFWLDADRQVPAPEGDDGTRFTRIFSYAKQHPKLDWFALMAGPCGDKSQSKHVSSKDGGSINGFDGELCFYVNDVPRHYENNGGRIFIQIGPAKRK